MKKTLSLTDELLSKKSIHLATGAKDKFEPLRKFKQNEFEKWQEDQNKENFDRPYVLSLIHMQPNQWLFGGIYEVLSVKECYGGFKYKTRITPESEELVGKLFIGFKKVRTSHLPAENVIDQMQVIKKLNSKYIPLESRM